MGPMCAMALLIIPLFVATAGRRIKVMQSSPSHRKRQSSLERRGPHLLSTLLKSNNLALGWHAGHNFARVDSLPPKLQQLRAARLLLEDATTEPWRFSPYGDLEAKVEVRDAGVKGLGAFAAESIRKGRWVSTYVGKLMTSETSEKFGDHTEYQFALSGDFELRIDAQNSTHFSRYYNHAEHPTLAMNIDSEQRRIDFFAIRDVEKGEELTFDYGVTYWLGRDPPSPDSDSRNFSAPIYRDRPPELSILHPPPVGTVFPLTPLTPPELQAALALPEEESIAALLRCVEFFGARRTQEGALEVRFGVGANAERQVLAQPDHAILQRAATACLAQAVLDPGDPSGATSRAFCDWVDQRDVWLNLIRRWRSSVPRFASLAHDAVALATYLLWTCPEAHGVTKLLTDEEFDSLIAQFDQDVPGGRNDTSDVIETLVQHAPAQKVNALIATLQRWYELGDGCTVTSISPPKLEGAVPQQLSRVWNRAPRLMEAGILSHEYRSYRLDLEDDE